MTSFVVAESTIAGLGVFTLHDITKGATLFTYGGRVVLADEDPQDTRYIFHNTHRYVFLDARDDNGNALRFLRYDRSNPPRALYEYVNVDPGNRDHPTIAKFANHLPSTLANCRITRGGRVIAKRRIRRGEEITYTYGTHRSLPVRRQGEPLRL